MIKTTFYSNQFDQPHRPASAYKPYFSLFFDPKKLDRFFDVKNDKIH